MLDRVAVATLNAQGVSDGPRLSLGSIRATLPGVAVAGLQEVSNLVNTWSLRDQLARQLMGVAQDTSTLAKAGVAVVWDKGKATRVTGPRIRQLCEGIPGPDGMRARSAIAVDLELAHGDTISAVSAHRPPLRFRHLWSVFDDSLRGFLAQQPHPVVLFMDANTHTPPFLGWGFHTHRVKVDLIGTGPGVDPVGQPWVLGPTNSDHRAVVVYLAVGR